MPSSFVLNLSPGNENDEICYLFRYVDLRCCLTLCFNLSKMKLSTSLCVVLVSMSEVIYVMQSCDPSLENNELFPRCIFVTVIVVLTNNGSFIQASGSCKIGAETRQECQNLCDITSYCDAWNFKKSVKFGLQDLSNFSSFVTRLSLLFDTIVL